MSTGQKNVSRKITPWIRKLKTLEKPIIIIESKKRKKNENLYFLKSHSFREEIIHFKHLSHKHLFLPPTPLPGLQISQSFKDHFSTKSFQVIVHFGFLRGNTNIVHTLSSDNRLQKNKKKSHVG